MRLRIPGRLLESGSGTMALAALIAGALAGCAAPGSPAARPGQAAGLVRVRLMHREQAVPDARVTAVRNLGVAHREERVVVVAAPDGHAPFGLAPGNWYFSASAAQSAIFGWYGSNPVQVRAGETIEVTIPGVAAPPAFSATVVPPGSESVTGEVVGEEGAVSGAGVAFYLDASTQFRGPGYLEAQTDDSGRFETRVSPGRYWLVARRRSGPHPFGPLEVGDDFGFYPGNPLEVRAGQSVSVRLPAVRVLKKSGWSEPSALRTRVGGTIRDQAGRPLSGFRAFLHAQPTLLGKPEFVSEPSGPDGAYLVWVDRAGVYYLGARAEIGRAREQREALGLYRGTPDHAVEVRLSAGALPAFDIVVDGAP